MATNFRIKKVMRETGDESRLLFLNRFESYVLVPKDSREMLQILRSCHDNPCSRHFAAEMMLRKIMHKFYWPTMRKDVFEYVKTCDSCQRCRDFQEYPVESLRPIVCLEPFEIITLDYVGPFQTARGGFDYALFGICPMTEWLEIYATVKANGSVMIRCLDICRCSRFGYLSVIHTDNEPYFDNHECQDWATLHGIRWVYGSLGVAKTQGKVERSIRVYKSIIRKVVDKNPTEWAAVLPST